VYPELLAIIGLLLFMAHEFDEIILLAPYLRTAENNPQRRGLWWTNRRLYPSTEGVALCIAEEFFLVGIILIIASACSYVELVIGTVVALSLHLFGHMFDALRAHCWTPGSMTSVITFPLNAIAIVWCVAAVTVSGLQILLWTVVIGIALMGNLQFMLRVVVPRLDPKIHEFYDSKRRGS
jgi:hypothetical protein